MMPARPGRIDVDFAVREARQKATAVRAKHAKPGLPVCPFAIAQKRRIQVTRTTDLPRGVVGRLDYLLGESRAVVSLAEEVGNERMERFTLAHEIGHFEIEGHFDILFADGQTSHTCNAELGAESLHERQANAFASELLMPRVDCLRYLKQLPDDDDGLPALLALADTCLVSVHAAANAYVDLIERPTALIVSQGTTVQYCARSKELKDRHGRRVENIAKGSTLPAHSLAARLTDQQVAAACRPKPTDDLWCNWFPGASRGSINQEVLGLGSYGKVITILTDNDWGGEAADDDAESED